MTKQADFKRGVRARMAKTGESYATAPQHAPGRAPGRHAGRLRARLDARPVQRTTGVRLTGTGAQVLAGQADHIALNGIDRWIGGVHLQGHHVPWRWDDGSDTLIRLPPSPSPQR